MNIKNLTAKIKNVYEEGVTLAEAEKLAAEFLHAQLYVSEQLTKADLDARMKKTGVKAVRAASYMAEATKGEKKPSDSFIEAIVNQDKQVIQEQDLLDSAEVGRNELENLLSIFKDAHIFFRGVSKGRFE